MRITAYIYTRQALLIEAAWSIEIHDWEKSVKHHFIFVKNIRLYVVVSFYKRTLIGHWRDAWR